MESNITIHQLAKLVREMRQQQNEYFRWKTKTELIKSKKLEIQVDQVLKSIPPPTESEPGESKYLQQNLFL